MYPLAGIAELDVEKQLRLRRAAEALGGVSGNAALLLHREGRAPEEVQRYIERYSLRTPEEASHSMRFLMNPLFRSYVFNYAVGKTLLAPLLDGPDALANFERLLSEPFTPSQVRLWLAQSNPKQSSEGALIRGTEPVADPALSHNQPWFARISLEFPAQIGDMHVQRACAIPISGTPHSTKKLIPRNNLSRPLHEQRQDTTCKRTQLVDQTIHLKATLLGVQTHILRADDVG